MTAAEMDRIMSIDPNNVWMPDLEYDPGYVSDEENEELTRLLESLTEDDLETTMIERVNRFNPSISEVVYLKDEL